MQAIFEALLNKGGAGTTISRADTVAALNPLLQAQTRLLHAYAYAQQTLPPGTLPESVAEAMRTARMDAGKVSETVLSSGGVSYNGTDVEPGTVALNGSPGAVLRALIAEEEGVLRAVKDSLKTHDHHIRTGAILGNLVAHGEARLTALREAARRARD